MERFSRISKPFQAVLEALKAAVVHPVLSYAVSGDCTPFAGEASVYLGAAPVATSNSPLASK